MTAYLDLLVSGSGILPALGPTVQCMIIVEGQTQSPACLHPYIAVLVSSN